MQKRSRSFFAGLNLLLCACQVGIDRWGAGGAYGRDEECPGSLGFAMIYIRIPSPA